MRGLDRQLAQMHELTLFTGIIPRKGLFLFDIAPTREIEFPWRAAKRCLLIHIWPGKAIVIGRWRWSGLDEHEALLAALEGEEIGDVQQQSGFGERLKEAAKNQGHMGHA